MKEAFFNWLRQDLRKWLLSSAKDLASLFMLFVISVAICAGLLYILKALWFTYISTPTGEHFTMHFDSRADSIERAFLVLSAISILLLLSPCIRLVSGLLPEIKAIWVSISSFAQKG